MYQTRPPKAFSSVRTLQIKHNDFCVLRPWREQPKRDRLFWIKVQAALKAMDAAR